LVSVNSFAETMSVNLAYADLNTFLKSCVLEEGESLKHYHPFLASCFYKFYRRIPKNRKFLIQHKKTEVN